MLYNLQQKHKDQNHQPEGDASPAVTGTRLPHNARTTYYWNLTEYLKFVMGKRQFRDKSRDSLCFTQSESFGGCLDV